jgi:CheY-like chemotaxis protein
VYVLIADDEKTHLFLLEMFLRKWGFEVYSTGDGAEALAWLEQEESPCLAILDWQMPGADGLEVTRWIKGGPRAMQVYVVMLTAKAQQADRLQALESGVDVFLSKPYDPDQLREILLEGQRKVSPADPNQT